MNTPSAMNPLTKEELQELASLVPQITIEWAEDDDTEGVLWVARRSRVDGISVTAEARRAQELIGPESLAPTHVPYYGRYRLPRPGVLTFLKFIEAIGPASNGKVFPD